MSGESQHPFTVLNTTQSRYSAMVGANSALPLLAYIQQQHLPRIILLYSAHQSVPAHYVASILETQLTHVDIVFLKTRTPASTSLTFLNHALDCATSTTQALDYYNQIASSSISGTLTRSLFHKADHGFNVPTLLKSLVFRKHVILNGPPQQIQSASQVLASVDPSRVTLTYYTHDSALPAAYRQFIQSFPNSRQLPAVAEHNQRNTTLEFFIVGPEPLKLRQPIAQCPRCHHALYSEYCPICHTRPHPRRRS
ncbi:hypothetical protein [Arcanobacterium wilhelmae]|nr:hypothetical protein [Arcanobacterium wilhelmae]